MPQRKISLKDFKSLVRRRNIALSRHRHHDNEVSSPPVAAGTTAITILAVSDNPNPNFNLNSDTGVRESESEVVVLKEEEEGEGDTKKQPVARAEEGSELEGEAGSGKLNSELPDLVAVEIKPRVEDHNTVVENEVKVVLEDCQVKMDGNKEGEILLKPDVEFQVCGHLHH